MKTLLAFLLLASMAFAQEKQVPKQGPPPKNLTARADGHFSANADPANPEKFQIYVVKPGDTLSQIAGQVLKNPGLWPQLWEQNEQIVNPHWIYPNDKILIHPVTTVTEAAPPEVSAPAPEAEQEPAPTAARAQFTPRPALTSIEPRPAPLFNSTPRKSAPEIKYSDMYCSGFIRATTIPDTLKVVSKYDADEGALAAAPDYVYIGKGAEDGVKVGDAFQVVRPTREVSDAQHRKLGTHYLDIGKLQVVMAQPDFSMARVVSNCEGLEIGDIMIPFVELTAPALAPSRPFSPLMQAKGDVKGSIATTLGVLSVFGSAFKGSGVISGAHSGSFSALANGVASAGNIVYLNVGQRDNVSPGDTFIVYQAANKDQELYGLPAGAEKLKGYRVAVGEVVILKVEERASTALVTYATNGLLAGDSVERR